MPWKVFEVSAEGATALEKDDLVSRQSLTIKDGAPFEIENKVVLVEGSEEGLARAAEIVEEHEGTESDKSDEVHASIQEEEEAAQGGVGFLFGE